MRTQVGPYRNSWTIGSGFLVFALFSLCFLAGSNWAFAKVNLEPLEDATLNRILEQAFVLPMVLEASEGSAEARQEQIDAEVHKLTDLLRALGYLTARVDVIDAGGGDITLRPVPAELYRIGWVSLVGLPEALSEETVSEFEDFTAEFVGRNATRNNLTRMERGLVWRLRNSRYALAHVVEADMNLTPGVRAAGLTIRIGAGRPFYFGKIRFVGSKHTDILESMSSVDLSEGAAYSAGALEELLEDLRETELFRRVELKITDFSDASGAVNLEVHLTDNQAGSSNLQTEFGIGPSLSVLTMLLIVFRECTSGTNWLPRAVNQTLSVAVTIFYVSSISFIFSYVYSTVLLAVG